MGQVVTLMPLLQQTFIMEDGGEYLNQVGGKSGYTTQTVGGKTGYTAQSIQTVGGKTGYTTPVSSGSGTPISFTPTPSPSTPTPSGSGSGSGTPISFTPSPSGSGGSGGNGSVGTNFNIPNWNILACNEVASEVQRLTNIRMQKINRPAQENELLDANIAIGNSILQNECQPSGSGGGDMGGGFGGGDFGTSGFGSGEGFGESGFGASGDFQQPTADQYQVLAYDKLGCPIYGYDENGTPLYGVDQNGNIITDPNVLPCAMKAMKKDESPVKQITSDITFKVSAIILGGIALFTLINNK